MSHRMDDSGSDGSGGSGSGGSGVAVEGPTRLSASTLSMQSRSETRSYVPRKKGCKRHPKREPIPVCEWKFPGDPVQIEMYSIS